MHIENLDYKTNYYYLI